MHKYCKAYPLQQLRQFASWKENHAEDQPALTDDTIVFRASAITTESSIGGRFRRT